MEKALVFSAGALATWYVATMNFKPALDGLPFTGDINFNLRQSPEFTPTFFYGPLNNFKTKEDYDLFANPTYVEQSRFERLITSDKLINNPNYGPYNQLPAMTLNPNPSQIRFQ
jgi:hypothetical protein